MKLPLHPANGATIIGKRVPFQKNGPFIWLNGPFIGLEMVGPFGRPHQKKSHPLPLLQILPSPTFLLDATVESYNRDPSLLPSQKKSHFEILCVVMSSRTLLILDLAPAAMTF